MRVLALDTATSACSVALWHEGVVVARRFVRLERGHAEALAPMIRDVLSEAAIAATAIDRLGVTIGPGAFTGLRVGLATARGLALAIGRPLIGITTFEAIAHGLPDDRIRHPVLIAVDSRRRELFLQRFDADLRTEGEPAVLDPESCAAWLPSGPLLVAGDGAAALRAALAGRPGLSFLDGLEVPDAAVMARLIAGFDSRSGHRPRPLYLRAPDVTLPPGVPAQP